MRPPLSSLSSVAPRLCPMWALSLASILLSLPPASVPQMPRFDLSSSVFPGQPRQPPAPASGQDKRPRCPGPGEVPWCQCREDNSGLSVSCHNINQVNYSNCCNNIDSSYRVPQSNFKLYLSELLGIQWQFKYLETNIREREGDKNSKT